MKATVAGARWDARTHLAQRTREALWGYVCILPWLLGFLLFTAGPMIFSLGLSFYKVDYMTPSVFVGLDNYRRMLAGEGFWLVALRNTAVYAFTSVPLHIALALLMAMLLNQKVRALPVWRTIFYLPSVVQGIAVAVLWIWLFNPQYGPISNTLRSVGIRNPPEWLWSEVWAMPSLVIMSTWGIGGSMIILLAGLQGVPQSLYDAASIDGAGPLGRFRYVTLPMMTPTLFFCLVMGLIGAWQMFTQSFVMTNGGPNNATLTAVMVIYRRAFEAFNFGYASTLAWALFFIILCLTLLVIRTSSAWVYYEGELVR